MEKEKKRILIFSTAYLPLIGGAEIAVKEITGRLSGFNFVVITARMDSKLLSFERVGNVDVYRIGKGDKWDKIRLIFQGVTKAKELGDFNIVWGIMASYGGFAALKYKKQFSKTPFLLTLQEGDSLVHIYSRVWWCWPWFKRIFMKADSIQAISNYLAGWAKKMGVECPIEVVPNGVEIKRFERAKSPQSYTDLRSDFGIKAEDKIVITVSRLVKKNGVIDLIKALKYLPNHIHLLIAGIGELQGKIKKIVAINYLESRVHFLGNINHEELPKYLWMSDVFCRPSLSEGLGNVFLEAMAAEVPIVGTDVGGIPDFLRDNENGLFCEVNNPRDVAVKIKKIIHDEKLRNKLIKNGKKLVEEKYSWHIVSEKMKNILNDLCEY